MKYLFPTGVLLITHLFLPALSVAEDHAVEPVVATHAVAGDFDSIAEGLKFAIQNQGLVLSGTSHLQEMLDRTAADLGYMPGTYVNAVSYEFCSASLAHKMFRSERRNIATCPMTIAAYVLPDAPHVVNLAYRNPTLAAKDKGLEKEIKALYQAIIDEATAW